MAKNALTVYNISHVKTLHHQVNHQPKKKRVMENFWMDVSDDKPEIAQDTHQYLQQLHTYLLALALAGHERVNTPGRSPADENVLGADTTEHVAVPLNIVYKYYWRAQRMSSRQPAAVRLQWLRLQ